MRKAVHALDKLLTGLAGDMRKAKVHLDRARALAKTPGDRKAVEEFDKRYGEHSKMLKKISREKP